MAYIDRNKFIQNLETDKYGYTDCVKVGIALDKAKADVVEVVRCRNCKHSVVNELHQNKPLICCLTKMCGTVDPNWYCADGEKALKERDKE